MEKKETGTTGYININQMKTDEVTKKPFNKKKWREQKYSCRAKVQKWETIRRKKSQKLFIEECKKFNIKFNSRKHDVEHIKKKKPFGNFKKAHLQYLEMQKIKEEKRKEQERIKKEKNEAIEAYKEKRAARFKKISQKTRKGQPLMRGRIELMLEKIQKFYVNNET